MSTVEQLQQELQKIHARNVRVEADKAWETSLFRKVSIILVTYVVAFLFLKSIGVEQPAINALMPTIGFFLSTLSLSIVKQWWLQHRYKKGT